MFPNAFLFALRFPRRFRVSFVIGSSLLLKEEGKIGFVLPAEILQLSYARPLREFLAHFYNKINTPLVRHPLVRLPTC